MIYTYKIKADIPTHALCKFTNTKRTSHVPQKTSSKHISTHILNKKVIGVAVIPNAL